MTTGMKTISLSPEAIKLIEDNKIKLSSFVDQKIKEYYGSDLFIKKNIEEIQERINLLKSKRIIVVDPIYFNNFETFNAYMINQDEVREKARKYDLEHTEVKTESLEQADAVLKASLNTGTKESESNTNEADKNG